MIPNELKPRRIRLPEPNNDYSIVLITGDKLRHQRFAYRVEKEFPDLVFAWYQVESTPILRNTESPKGKLLIRNLLYTYLQRGIRKQVSYEKRLFEQEVIDLARDTKLEPVLVKNPDSREFIECIRKLSPYFLLSHGGPLYKKDLLESVRGVAINQHAGWSPTYKGTGTTRWPLYHRNLDYLGSTVHITTTSADAGPILRRSHPCLVSGDTPDSCTARVAALGTELIIEVVAEIISSNEISIYDQPIDLGKTYVRSQLDRSILEAIHRDFSDNWLEKELSRLRSF